MNNAASNSQNALQTEDVILASWGCPACKAQNTTEFVIPSIALKSTNHLDYFNANKEITWCWDCDTCINGWIYNDVGGVRFCFEDTFKKVINLEPLTELHRCYPRKISAENG